MNLLNKLGLGKSRKTKLEQQMDFGVLFVCMGNICRSPTAEAVFKNKIDAQGIPVFIDSAGTIGNHAGQKPDPRAISAGEKRGYDFGGLRSRKVELADYFRFNYILAMDKDNYKDLIDRKPADATAKVELMLDYADNFDNAEVPDPYYGGARGFEFVLDLVEDASDGFISKRLKSVKKR